MRVVEHYANGTDRLLRVEAEGCAVNIIIGLHDESGSLLTAVEVEPRLPDQQGMVWKTDGTAAVVVRCHGQQMLAGDGTSVGEEMASGGTSATAESQAGR
jgi:hypothetical protein